MLKNKYLIVLYVLSFSIINAFYAKENYEAFIKKPVINIATKSLNYLAKEQKIESIYKNFACSPEIGPDSCARVYQLLFNERIKVKKEVGDEVEFEISNVFYQDEQKNKINTFWTLKKYLTKLSELSSEEKAAIPKNLADINSLKIFLDDNILTLILPWQDSLTNRNYSVGTRFERLKKLDQKNELAIKILDKNLNSQIAYIPKNLCLSYIPKTKSESKKIFIDILKKWATLNIPYVWGGGSCIKKHSKTDFILSSKIQNNQEIKNWIRPDEKTPYNGFDCSGLVLRAAQISYLNYFYKNTTTLASNLEKLQENTEIQDGDLIWQKGHVMIVSDVKNNLLIEAVSYSSGYGIVHEINLDKVFYGISNYSDLSNAYKNKLSLKRLNSKGEIYNQIQEFFIFRI